MQIEVLKSVVGNPNFDAKKIVSNQNSSDIMKELLEADKLYYDQYKKLAPYFDNKNNVTVANNIFDFLKKNIKYVIESEARQTTKSPAILLHTKQGDCKNYSNFAAGIFRVLGIPYKYRFASYKYTDPRPSHVYIVYKDNDGKDRIFDAVLNTLGQEARYKHIIDKKPMALVRLSGIDNVVGGDDEIIGKGRIKKALKKAGQGIKKVVKKVKGKVATVYAAPIRAAFLGIIAINAFKSRDKLAAAIRKDPDKVKKWWNNFGGNWTSLKKSAKVSGAPDDAVVGVALATLAATAAPIVIAFRSLLKDMGAGDLEGADGVGSDIASVTDQGGSVTDADTGQTLPAGNRGTADAKAQTFSTKNILLIGGAAAALYFLSRKK